MANYLSASSTAGDFGSNQPGESDYSGDAEGFLPVSRLVRQYVDFLSAGQLEIEEQKQARHYYHGSHWTAEQIRILRARRQPITTFNRIARKINGVVGLLEGFRADPKAYPRNPRDEEGAELATATIRYVLEANDWKTTDGDQVQQAGIDGIAGVQLTLVEGDKGDPDIAVKGFFTDDYFYDKRSNRPDFSDGRFEGFGKWLDEDAAVELFPDKEDDIRGLVDQGSDLTTHSDREQKYMFVNEGRVRLVEHWYKHRGKWRWAFYIGFHLIDQGISPFINEKGESDRSILAWSAMVDQDGDRYGFIRNLKGPQDALNQGRSKALHISNSRRVIADKGAVADVETARREWARPDGWVEKNKGFEIAPDAKIEDLKAHMELTADARDEIETFANVNPALIAAGQGLGDYSGRAINLLQKAGIAELGPFIRNYRAWKLRVYRAVWNAAQRHWTAERWIRVTDDKQVAQFIQLNGVDLDQWGRPVLVNAVGQLDVDIILDEGPETLNMMADAFDLLAKQPAGTIPVPVLIELMPIQGSIKQRILQMLQAPPDPLTQEAKVAEVQRVKAEVGKYQAGALKDTALAAKAASEAHLNAAQVFAAGVNEPDIPDLPGRPAPMQMRLDQMAQLAGNGNPPGVEPAQLTTAPPPLPPAFQPQP